MIRGNSGQNESRGEGELEQDTAGSDGSQESELGDT